MFYYILRDNVSNELTPVFNQNTDAAAARVLANDGRILEQIDSFSISRIARSGVDSQGVATYQSLPASWMDVKTFIDNYSVKKDKDKE